MKRLLNLGWSINWFWASKLPRLRCKDDGSSKSVFVSQTYTQIRCPDIPPSESWCSLLLWVGGQIQQLPCSSAEWFWGRCYTDSQRPPSRWSPRSPYGHQPDNTHVLSAFLTPSFPSRYGGILWPPVKWITYTGIFGSASVSGWTQTKTSMFWDLGKCTKHNDDCHMLPLRRMSSTAKGSFTWSLATCSLLWVKGPLDRTNI